jgi:FkbM family methyltransferase
VLKRLGIREVTFHPRDLPAPVYCRIEGSDIWEYQQSLGDWAVPINLPFVPRTIVDVGANVGYASLRFVQAFPGAKIIAIEPARQNHGLLKKNCSPYPDISLEFCALWPKSGSLRILDSNAGHNAYQVVEDPQGDIPAMAMGDILARYKIDSIDLLKIDIEGSEKILFEDTSTAEWLPKVRALLIETHDRMVPGCSDSVARAMRGLGVFKGHVNEYEYWSVEAHPGSSVVHHAARS